MSKIDLKVVLLGKQYGGKTSLAERFLHNRFSGDSVPYQNTIGAAFGAKRMEFQDYRSITMGVWDTAGSERYESMSRIYYRGAGAAVICYDLTDDSSFERAQFWVKELKKHEENCKLYLCGTKTDLIHSNKHNRKVDYHTTTDYAEEIGAQVFETSSKTGELVEELFYKVAEDYVKTATAVIQRTGVAGVVLNQEQTRVKQKSDCCGLLNSS